MKTGQILFYPGLYLFVAAGVIPSPVMSYAFNLFAFGAVVFLIFALCMAVSWEEIIKKALVKTKAETPEQWKLEEKKWCLGRRKLFAIYAPVTIVMIACGHWIAGSCWFIAGTIMWCLFEKTASEMKKKETADE